MGVKLTDVELDEFLGKGHTLMVSTIRKSGEPLTVPMWYVWMDGGFWIGTPSRSAKVQHIKRDPRVCCVVEEGDKWVDLKVVVANCDAVIVESEAELDKFKVAMDEKYQAFRPDRSNMPQATRNHYSGDRAVIKMTPRVGEVRSWYNRKIRMVREEA
jgi:nitroimidazol reductase NimA-like FMN-containing flavoprotein (pyridoxamine 5'-phosphate oxidase superfamily)